MILTQPNLVMTQEDLDARPLPETTMGDYLRAKLQVGFKDNSLMGAGIEGNKLLLAEEQAYGTFDTPVPDSPFVSWVDRILGIRKVYKPGEMPEEVRRSIPRLTEQEWKSSPWYREKIAWDEQMSPARAQALAEVHDERRQRAALIEHRPFGLSSILGFGSLLFGSAFSPENYIPFLGHATKLRWISKLGPIIGRTAAGAVEGAIGNMAVAPALYNELNRQGEDYGLREFFWDTTMGGAVGSLFGAGMGGWAKFRGETKVSILKALEQAAVDVREGRVTDVGPFLRDVVPEEYARVQSSPEALAFRDALVATEKFTPEQADATAIITQRHAEAWAETYRKTPEEWWMEKGIKIQTGTYEGQPKEALLQESSRTMTRIAENELINGITREEAGHLMAKGDEEVLLHIREGIQKHGIMPMQDAIRNQEITEVVQTPKGPQREIVQQRIAELRPQIDRIFDEARATAAPEMGVKTFFQRGEQALEKVSPGSFPLIPPKGAVVFTDNATVIHLFESADVSTVLHELGHIFRRDLSLEDAAIVESWAGVEAGKWTKQTEEKFATAWEKYLYTGQAPVKGLVPIFERLKQWFTNIYRAIRSLDSVQISDEMRGVFDRLITTNRERGIYRVALPRLSVSEDIRAIGRQLMDDLRIYGEKTSDPIATFPHVETLPRPEAPSTVEMKGPTSEAPPIKKTLIPDELVPAIAIMRAQVYEGKKGQRFFGKEDGFVTGVKSTYPEWFQYKQKEGSTWQGKWSRKEFDDILAKAEAGRPLTAKQQERFEELIRIAQWTLENDRDLSEGVEMDRLVSQGFQPVDKQMPAGNLNPGDKVVLNTGLATDEFTHLGYDVEGKAVLQDGDTYHVDPWDMLDVVAVKQELAPSGERTQTVRLYDATLERDTVPEYKEYTPAPEERMEAETKTGLRAEDQDLEIARQEVDILTEEGKVHPSYLAELKAADEFVSKTDKWNQALRVAAVCLGRG